jgi:hypothetical protein
MTAIEALSLMENMAEFSSFSVLATDISFFILVPYIDVLLVAVTGFLAETTRLP